eukprot:TRINITY_DN12359_c0_g1_i1.p1 TRINITY_DN12359_c0_g1~~TRINITY_DN12359_c0_g1_i1.p1  ORF type:complete len:309 (-),score=67.66 TRINITY_DN12359_c0_g1_i1:132-1001(-)
MSVVPESSPSERPRKRPKTDSTPVVPKEKRRPYTRMACFNCREKHQKCDGQKPACTNCFTKGHDCRYREERNKKRIDGGNVQEEIYALRTELEHWRQKYFELKQIVDETFFPMSSLMGTFLPPQLPFPGQMGHKPDQLGNTMVLNTSTPQSIYGGILSPQFDFYPPGLSTLQSSQSLSNNTSIVGSSFSRVDPIFLGNHPKELQQDLIFMDIPTSTGNTNLKDKDNPNHNSESLFDRDRKSSSDHNHNPHSTLDYNTSYNTVRDFNHNSNLDCNFHSNENSVKSNLEQS